MDAQENIPHLHWNLLTSLSFMLCDLTNIINGKIGNAHSFSDNEQHVCYRRYIYQKQIWKLYIFGDHSVHHGYTWFATILQSVGAWRYNIYQGFRKLKIMWPLRLFWRCSFWEASGLSDTACCVDRRSFRFCWLFTDSIWCAGHESAAMLFKAPQGAELIESGFRLWRSIFQWLFPGDLFGGPAGRWCSVRC